MFLNKRIVRRALSSGTSTSKWGAVKAAPPDKILGLNEAFNADTFPQKVNLGVGAYRDDQGKPYVLNSVKKAEQNIMSRNVDHEYNY